MPSLSEWLQRKSHGGPVRAERRPAPGLLVYDADGDEAFPIKDLSSSGVYLYTSESWPLDQVVGLHFQKSGPRDDDFDHIAVVQARTVRAGMDGMGLSFDLPRAVDFDLWGSPHHSMEGEPEPEDILRELRVAAARAFLVRIAPSATEALNLLFRTELGNLREAAAAEIALKAEHLLRSVPRAQSLRVHPGLLVGLLERGSWADDPRVRCFWSGLLCASCQPDRESEANSIFLHPLSQLTLLDVRILADACNRSTKVLTAGGALAAEPHVYAMDDLLRLAGTRDIARIRRAIDNLADEGVVERRAAPLALLPISEAHVTPTAFGLELYARCNGFRGTPSQFYGLTSLAGAAPGSPLTV